MSEYTQNPQGTQADGRLGGNGVLALVENIGVGNIRDAADHVHHSRIPFSAMTLSILGTAVSGYTAYTSQRIFQFPIGRIAVLHSMAAVALTVASPTTGSGSTITSGAVGSWGLGTSPVASAAIPLSGAAQNLVAATSIITAAQGIAGTTGTTVMGALNGATIGALGMFDGTSSAISGYFNLAIPNNSTVNTAQIVVSGTIHLTWLYVGDI